MDLINEQVQEIQQIVANRPLRKPKAQSSAAYMISNQCNIDIINHSMEIRATDIAVSIEDQKHNLTVDMDYIDFKKKFVQNNVSQFMAEQTTMKMLQALPVERDIFVAESFIDDDAIINQIVEPQVDKVDKQQAMEKSLVEERPPKPDGTYFHYYGLYQNKYRNPLKVENPEEYAKNGIFCTQKSTNITNPHNDGANLRAYYENQNLSQYLNYQQDKVRYGTKLTQEQFGFTRPLVDVGSSGRLISNPPTYNTVALVPEAQFGDLERISKRPENKYITVLPMTLQSYIENCDTCPNTLFNFTDSLYYIDNNTLYKTFNNSNYGVVATGSLHIPSMETDGFLYANGKTFGRVYTNDHDMTMQILGNPEVYNHPIRFAKLAKYDTIVIEENPQYNYRLVVQVKDRYDFGATLYSRIIIVKQSMKKRLPNTMPSFYKRKCNERLQNSVNVGHYVDNKGIVHKTDYNTDGQGLFTLPSGDKAVFTRVKNVIRAAKVDAGDLPLESDGGFMDWIKDKISYISVGEIRSDFMITIEEYNDIVKQIIKSTNIDRKTIVDAMFLAKVKLPSAHLFEIILPIVSSALKDAAQLEVRIAGMLKDKSVSILKRAKNGNIKAAETGIFTDIARWIFGNNDIHMDEYQGLQPQAKKQKTEYHEEQPNLALFHAGF